jgi:aminoglycoside 6'-N-acetyltransferase
VSVSLRRADAADVGFLVALVTHEDVAPFLAASRPSSEAELVAEIRRSEAEPDAFGVFVIEDGGAPVGTMSFECANRRSRIANLSGFALDPPVRGRGIAREATRLVQRHLMDDLGFHRLQLEVYAFNKRALAHAERCGFTREGVRRKAYWREGTWVDGVLFGLVAEDLKNEQ